MLLPEARHRFKSYLTLHFKLLDNVVPPWRNWQTRWTQNPVPIAGVPVRSRPVVSKLTIRLIQYKVFQYFKTIRCSSMLIVFYFARFKTWFNTRGLIM